jgi:hypothetical protein
VRSCRPTRRLCAAPSARPGVEPTVALRAHPCCPCSIFATRWRATLAWDTFASLPMSTTRSPGTGSARARAAAAGRETWTSSSSGDPWSRCWQPPWHQIPPCHTNTHPQCQCPPHPKP